MTLGMHTQYSQTRLANTVGAMVGTTHCCVKHVELDLLEKIESVANGAQSFCCRIPAHYMYLHSVHSVNCIPVSLRQELQLPQLRRHVDDTGTSSKQREQTIYEAHWAVHMNIHARIERFLGPFRKLRRTHDGKKQRKQQQPRRFSAPGRQVATRNSRTMTPALFTRTSTRLNRFSTS